MVAQSIDVVSQADSAFQKANQLKQKGQLEAALTQYRYATEVCPEKAEYHQELGDTLTQAGQFNSAELAYQKVIELRPDWFKPYYSLGVVLDKQGKIQEAFDYYQQSIQISPNFAWSYFHLGHLYEQKGLPEEAADCYRTAIKVHPPENSYWFHLKFGDLLIKQGKFNLAIDSYTNANKINPNNPQGSFKLGKAFACQKNWQKAINQFRQTIQLQPDFHDAYVELGDALSQINKQQQAIESYQKALEIKPNDAKSYQRLQQCLIQSSVAEDPELQECYQILQQENHEPEVYLKIGQTLTKQGLVEDAVKAYLKLLKVQPTFAPVYENLKHAALYLKNLDELIATYREIIQQHPQFLPASVNLGDTLTQQGQMQAALDCYQKAVDQKALAKAPELVKKHRDEHQPRQPHFIIIGAEKCGTSSLHEYIIQHPQVLEPVEKEIHFFTQVFDQGLPWYEAHFPPISPGSGYMTGEASTSYIGCHNNAPQRLFNLYPNVKLLAVLRDPVERAISHYNQLVRLGREGRSLEEVMTAEMEVLEGVEDIWSVRQQYWSVGKGCIWHGLYAYFLEQWMSVFPKEQFLILLSEELFEQPEETMKQVFEFLELPDYQLPSYPQYNSGGVYKDAKNIIRLKMIDFFKPFNEKLRLF